MAKQEFGAKEKNALRAKLQKALNTLVTEGMGLEVHVTHEGLVARLPETDVLFKVVLKNDRVDFDAEAEELADKAKAKAEKEAKARAKAEKDAQKRAEKEAKAKAEQSA